FAAGATAALVCRGKIDPMKAAGPLVEVDDVPAALEALAHAARARSGAYITAVTGSVGKTSVKEALRLALSKSGETFASEKSFNNHIGVPLSLARMPQDCAYGVFEIGMNHAGEIAALVEMVRPHTAIITHIGSAHIEHLGSEEAIARAKAEIFNDMANDVVEGGTVIIPADNPHIDLLVELAEARGIADIRRFSTDEMAAASEPPHIVASKIYLHETCSCVSGRIGDAEVTFKVGTPGAHHVSNSLAVLGAVQAAGADLALAALSLAEVEALSGRGRRHVLDVAGGPCVLIDESYNANPASMSAAIKALGLVPRLGQGRRIAVLGDMAELGEASKDLHMDIAGLMDTVDIDLVFSCGPQMAHMFAHLPPDRRGIHAPSTDALTNILQAEIHAGDVVMVKGSHASRMNRVVDALLGAETARAGQQGEQRDAV
ncbi:MAG: UDP-N-acetylmuramoyl-tripeptide--D-alanyl-D-alanine ligase, partial [Pseudomonadota bacterium]|nr:UDP-N-acetylmuramoyl-tripeptide--D-alanyl-D-alanine ligase [Pseudomonadota bacterium]